MLTHCHNQKKQHLKYRNWVVDCSDWPTISAIILSFESIYSVSIQPCLPQGCCHSECLAFTPFDGYLKLWELIDPCECSVWKVTWLSKMFKPKPCLQFRALCGTACTLSIANITFTNWSIVTLFKLCLNFVGFFVYFYYLTGT